ncbi:monooxygenase [Cordyceps javanica]|uniref:Monooxygenase n=1 Tax=Cordyceps javanica TaxID=43265 RepID=A0A545V5R3_9HYPO|nr:monooxygenase [Cordyceps javanica]TQW08304.1 monooxygenase [Cordyceps javanica]
MNRHTMSAGISPCHFLSGKTIVVVGAGISGSAFVASLRCLWDPAVSFPEIVVFDRDTQGTYERRGGYSLSLVGNHVSGGLVALNKMGLLADTLRNTIAGVGGAGSFTLWTSSWRVLTRRRRPAADGMPTTSVRISPNEIQRILLAAAHLDNENSVYWNTRCISVAKLSTGRLLIEVIQGDDSESDFMECDLLVAADGANSKIRTYLRPNDALEYTGAVMRTGVSRFSEALPEEIGRNWGFVLSGNGTSCFVSPVGEKDLQWAIGHFENQVPTNIRGLDHAKRVIKRASGLGSNIAEPFQTILSQTDPNTVMCINAHDKLPFQHSEIGTMPVIFIGDSNHALSPFAGYGANLGLRDAWDLAEELVNGSSLEEAVEAYDRISFPRAVKACRDARKRLRDGHSTGLRYLVLVLMLFLCRVCRWVLGR